MKSKPVRFGRAIVLSILLFLTVFSLIGAHDNPHSGWSYVHGWTGSLMLIGAAIHLVTNLGWVKVVFSVPAHVLKKRVRQNRFTDLGLFLSGAICTLSGVLWLLVPGDGGFRQMERWSEMHTISGIFMIVLLGIHLWLHRSWMANTARQLQNQQPSKADGQIVVSEPQK